MIDKEKGEAMQMPTSQPVVSNKGYEACYEGFVPLEVYMAGKGGKSTPTPLDEMEDIKEQTMKEEQYGLKGVMKFPTEIFPQAIQDFIIAQAKALPAPEDFLGVGVLSAISTVIGNLTVIKIKNSWDNEGCQLWACIIGDPSVRKTAALSKALNPLSILERDLRREYQSLKQQYKQDFEKCNIELDQWKVNVKKGKSTIEEMPEEPNKPSLKRLIVNKSTLEGLYKILEHNPTGIIKYNDELKSLFTEMNQYRAGNDRQTWIELYNKQPISIDLKSQEEPQVIEEPFVVVCGGTQPKTVENIVKDGMDDGLSTRFLFSYPETEITDWTDDDISEAIKKAYEEAIHKIYWSRPKEKRTLLLSSEAYEFFKTVINGLRAETKAPDFPQELIAPYGKLEGYLARFSLLLHVLEYSCLETKSEIYVAMETVYKAHMLIEYFKSHMKKVYNRTGETVLNKNCIKLIELVKKKGEKSDFGYELTFREIQRSNIFGKGLTTSDAVFEVATKLMEEGLGKITMKERKGQTQYKFIFFM
ncbi:DUF3987 domain-containing protein [Bacillus sp. AK031]